MTIATLLRWCYYRYKKAVSSEMPLKFKSDLKESEMRDPALCGYDSDLASGISAITTTGGVTHPECFTRTTWLGPNPEAARSSQRCRTTSASYMLQTSASMRNLRPEATRPSTFIRGLSKMRSYLRKLHVTN